MPCSDGRDYRNDDIRDLRERLDQATRAACELWAVLYRGGPAGDLTTDTLNWVTEHERQDQQRIQQEQHIEAGKQRRREALAKLTPDERRALGL